MFGLNEVVNGNNDIDFDHGPKWVRSFFLFCIFSLRYSSLTIKAGSSKFSFSLLILIVVVTSHNLRILICLYLGALYLLCYCYVYIVFFLWSFLIEWFINLDLLTCTTMLLLFRLLFLFFNVINNLLIFVKVSLLIMPWLGIYGSSYFFLSVH